VEIRIPSGFPGSWHPSIARKEEKSAKGVCPSRGRNGTIHRICKNRLPLCSNYWPPG
jgi:hypothetical protein